MNKSAVALAADSAVSVASGEGNVAKVFNTANKLFTLSKYHPVGVMYYNTSTLGGVPLETTVKSFRKRLGEGSRKDLFEYGASFIDFLTQHRELFPELQQRQVLTIVFVRLFAAVGQTCTSNAAVKVYLDKEIERLSSLEFSTGFDEDFLDQVREHYKPEIDEAAEFALSRAKLRNNISRCRQFAALKATKKELTDGFSGFVVAGFGEEDYFPKAIEYSMDLAVMGRIKYVEERRWQLGHFNRAEIIPFASYRMVNTLLEGVYPDYNQLLQEKMMQLFIRLPREILHGVEELSGAQKAKYYRAAMEAVPESFDSLMKELDQYRAEKHTNPIRHAISNMPLGELATVAEIFVNITQIKQRLSLSAETVGGPIDVAVISKSDGFVWIKRKHYFEPELNPHFVGKYFRT